MNHPHPTQPTNSSLHTTMMMATVILNADDYGSDGGDHRRHQVKQHQQEEEEEEEQEEQKGQKEQQQQPQPQLPPINIQQQKQRQRNSNHNHNNNNSKRRHGARNQNRHKIFVKWLLETFPSQLQASSSSSSSTASLNNNSDGDSDSFGAGGADFDAPLSLLLQQHDHHHILDVAGGKGEVSARLTLCHHQHVIMVDPRPANLVECFLKDVLPRLPNKWQRRFHDKCTTNGQNQNGNSNGGDGRSNVGGGQGQEESKSHQQTAFLQHRLNEQNFQQLITTFDDYTLETSPTLQRAVQNASLILGLHADGATEAIVDAALTYQKPFVVVPCCVFPNFFQQRQLLVQCGSGGDESGSSGRWVPVRTHEQFCQYLLRKDPRFQMTHLPFEGRNVAIWWDGT